MLTKATFVIVFILIVSVVAISAIADQSPIIHNPPTEQEANNKAANQKKTPETQNQDSTSPPAIINPTLTPPLQEIRDKEHQQYSKEQKSSWWNFSLTDALLAIFTCGLVIVGWLQVYILRGTLKLTAGLLGVAQEQSGDMKSSIAAAQKAADAAQKSAYAAAQTIGTLEAQERAYLFVTVKLDTSNNDPDEIIKTGTDGLPGVNLANIVVTNYGKTPADLMNIHRKVDCFDQSIDVVNYFADILAPSNPAVVPGTEIIISGEEKKYTTQFFVYPTELQNVINSTSKLLCVGCIQYEDVFGKLHNTVFCWEYQDLIENFIPCKEYRYNYRT